MNKVATHINFESINSKLIEIQGQKALLDIDVAELYGVETKRVNEAVKNNPDKFPGTYILELSKEDWNLLKTKFSTSIKGGKVKLPRAFTEKGLYMLATILKSKMATQTSLAIIETFAKVKELSQTIQTLSLNPEKEKQQSLMQKSGELFSELLDSELKTNESETTIELNFAVLKFKHTIKKS